MTHADVLVPRRARSRRRPNPRVAVYRSRNIKRRLQNAGIKLTRQRISLGWILFRRGDRHITAELLYEEARQARLPVSLATVYNTLNQFTAAGLLRRIAIDASKTYFDTNTSSHHHFFFEDSDGLMDIDLNPPLIGTMPIPPKGYEIAVVDLVVRLRPQAVDRGRGRGR